MKFIYLIVFFTPLSLVRAQTDAATTAVQMLKIDLAPYIKTLDRDIETYNYRTRQEASLPETGFIPKDLPEGITSAQTWAAATKKYNPKERGNLGWGFYTSSDPIATKNYGESAEEFVLTTLVYKAGSKLLDIRKYSYEIAPELPNPNLLPISENTRKYLHTICDFKPIKDAGDDEMKEEHVTRDRLVQDPKCHSLYNKALDELEIDGILYAYVHNGLKFCDSQKPGPFRPNRASAFVAINVEMTDETVDVFTNTSDLLKMNKKMVTAHLPFYIKLSVLEQFRGPSVYRDEIREENTTDFFKLESVIAQNKKNDVIAELKEKIFGCDEKYEKSDSPHYDPDLALPFLPKK